MAKVASCAEPFTLVGRPAQPTQMDPGRGAGGLGGELAALVVERDDMGTGDIQDNPAEIYGTEVFGDTISQITEPSSRTCWPSLPHR